MLEKKKKKKNWMRQSDQDKVNDIVRMPSHTGKNISEALG